MTIAAPRGPIRAFGGAALGVQGIIAGAAAFLLASAAAAQQTPDASGPKLTLRVSNALLYESNPASLPYGAKGFWSTSTIVGVDASAAIAPGVVLSAMAQNRFWRYPARARWHSNDASGNVALTMTAGALSYGARLSAFGSYDPGFSEKKELRGDAALFVSRVFVEDRSGVLVTPMLTLSQRSADDHKGDKTRIALSTAASRSFGQLTLLARAGVSVEYYRLCRPDCRRDLGLTAGLSATWALTSWAEIGAGVSFERNVSTRKGQGYTGVDAAPRMEIRAQF